MAQGHLNLLQGRPPLMGKLRKGLPQVVRSKRKPKLPGIFPDNQVNRLRGQAGSHDFPALPNRPQDKSVFEAGRLTPLFDAGLCPAGQRDGAESPAFAVDVDQDPASFALLNLLEAEPVQFVAPNAGPDQMALTERRLKMRQGSCSLDGFGLSMKMDCPDALDLAWAAGGQGRCFVDTMTSSAQRDDSFVSCDVRRPTGIFPAVLASWTPWRCLSRRVS